MKNNRLYLYTQVGLGKRFGDYSPFVHKSIESMKCNSYDRAREIAKKRPSVYEAVFIDSRGNQWRAWRR